jgi:hypothetical protein
MANRFQPFDFASVGDFLHSLPENELQITEQLRQLMFECIPRCREKLTYNVPFYYRHSRIAYIWPSSVPWGKMKRTGVDLGFCRGSSISDELGYLERGNRKMISVKSFQHADEIDETILRDLIAKAVEADESWYISSSGR